MSLEKVQLNNGLSIYHDRIAGEQTNSVKMLLPYGSVDEKPAEEGVAHVFEHCVHLKTDQFTSREDLRSYAARNGMITNANTSYTRTVYYADGLDLEPNMHHLSQILQHTHLPEDKVEHELKAIRREAMTRLDNTGVAHMDAVDNAIFGKPYGRDIIGYHDKLDFSADTLRQLHQRYYKLGRMSLIVSGKAKLDEVIALATRYFDADNTPYDTSHDSALPINLGRKYTTGLVRDEMQNVKLQLSYPMTPELRAHYLRNEISFTVAQSALSDACLNALRYDKGVADNGNISFSTYNHPNAWRLGAYATVGKQDINTTQTTFNEIFKRNGSDYSDDDITAALAESAYVLNSNLMTTDKRTNAHIRKLASYREPEDLAIDRRKLARLTVSDIRSAIDTLSEHVQSTASYTHLTGNRKDIGDVERIIERSDFA